MSRKKKRPLSDYERTKLEIIVDALRQNKQQQKKLKEAEEELKEAILSYYQEFNFENTDSPKTFRFTLESGKSIRITERDATLNIDHKKMMRDIPLDVFLQVFDIKKVELIPNEWEKAVEEEKVTQKDLLDALIEGEKPNPIIVVE